MNKYEQIKALSLEDLALFLSTFSAENVSVDIAYCKKHCPLRIQCDLDLIGPDDCYDLSYIHCMKIWLNEEVKENKND